MIKWGFIGCGQVTEKKADQRSLRPMGQRLKQL